MNRRRPLQDEHDAQVLRLRRLIQAEIGRPVAPTDESKQEPEGDYLGPEAA